MNYTIPDFISSKNAQEFDELGYTYLTNLISKEICEDFSKEMLFLKASNKLTLEEKAWLAAPNADPNVYRPSFGLGSIKKFDEYLKQVSEPIANKIDIKWKPQHTYCRIYYNGGVLGKHKDRSGLDYTLSLTLFSTLDKPWPLYAIDKKGNEINADTKVGDGLLILGTNMEHWREPLVCDTDQCVIQLFMHWAYPDKV
jgi:hypothetical protein